MANKMALICNMTSTLILIIYHLTTQICCPPIALKAENLKPHALKGLLTEIKN